METKNNELKKTGADEIKAPEQPIKLTPQEEFLLECDEQETAIFHELKAVLMNQCEKHEFEAINEDNLDDYREIITYIKNGIIVIENDGAVVKLRKPVTTLDKTFITDKIKILYERDETKERIFTKGIKISKKNLESQKEFTLGTLAASFDKIEGKMISLEATRLIQKKNHRDYMILLNTFNFFRN